MKYLISSIILFFSSNILFANDVTIKWPEGQSAVAWQSSKTMFLVSDSKPVGINNQVKVAVKVEADSRIISIEIPIKGFDSGDEARDADVFPILKGDIQPNLLFTSSPLSSSQWASLMESQLDELTGMLKIGGKDYPASFKLDKSAPKNLILGLMDSTFASFGLEAPSVAGGIVASVDEELNLWGRIYKKDLK